MILYEYEGKKLLKEAGIKVPESILITQGDSIAALQNDKHGWVLKAQVLSGKRADAGGIIFVDSINELGLRIKELFSKTINGEKVEKILIEERVAIEREYYLSISYDTDTRGPILSISSKGGTGIEEKKIDTYTINPLDRTVNIPHNIPIELINNIINLFFDQDCLLLEINPLVRISPVIPAPDKQSLKLRFQVRGKLRQGIQLEDKFMDPPISRASNSVFKLEDDRRGELEDDNSEWIALDAKIKLDDDAKGRHEDWDFPSRGVPGREPTKTEIAAKKIDEGDYRGVAGSTYFDLPGDIAVLSSGGGISLTAMDALLKHGAHPANFTEYSGNPPKEKVTKLTKIVLSKPNIHGLWVIGTVAANFTDIYETLSGLIEGLRETEKELGKKFDFPIIIRRGGPNEEKAFEMLREVKDFNLIIQGEETSVEESAQVMAEEAKEYAER